MTRKYFGTDGIRGKVGHSVITPEFVLKLGWAAGKVLLKHKGNSIGRVLIGKDTRISGYMLESALESGLSAAGIKSFLTGPLPTPAVSYLTRTLSMDAGIVISASHNKYDDNGIKFFDSNGLKLPDALELEIEKMLDQPLTCVDSPFLGKAARIVDAGARYIEFCKAVLGFEYSLKGIRIVVDCANGATYKIAPSVFSELGAIVHTIGVEPNGTNINKNCGSTDVALLQHEVVKLQADIGIAYDGDGDRVILVDHLGNIVKGDTILYILASYEKYKNYLNDKGVVGTIMSNEGLAQTFKEKNIPFARSQVGDRYVLQKMQELNWYLGGESSGHIIHYYKNTTGDGIIASICVLKAMLSMNKSLNEFSNEINYFYDKMIGIPTENLPSDILDHKETKNIITDAENLLKDTGRLIIRKSGTEPLIRAMAEHPNNEVVEKCLAIVNDYFLSIKGK